MSSPSPNKRGVSVQNSPENPVLTAYRANKLREQLKNAEGAHQLQVSHLQEVLSDAHAEIARLKNESDSKGKALHQVMNDLKFLDLERRETNEFNAQLQVSIHLYRKKLLDLASLLKGEGKLPSDFSLSASPDRLGHAGGIDFAVERKKLEAEREELKKLQLGSSDPSSLSAIVEQRRTSPPENPAPSREKEKGPELEEWMEEAFKGRYAGMDKVLVAKSRRILELEDEVGNLQHRNNVLGETMSEIRLGSVKNEKKAAVLISANEKLEDENIQLQRNSISVSEFNQMKMKLQLAEASVAASKQELQDALGENRVQSNALSTSKLEASCFEDRCSVLVDEKVQFSKKLLPSLRKVLEDLSATSGAALIEEASL